MMTTQQKAERVLISQGYAPMRLSSLPDTLQAALAKLCDDDGALADDAREKAGALIKNYFAEQKAVVDAPDATPDDATPSPQ